MRFRDSHLRRLGVFTESGLKIGTVIGLVIDGEGHAVSAYIAARSRLLSRLFPDELLIAPSQVVAIELDRMIVQDTITPVAAKEKTVYDPGLA